LTAAGDSSGGGVIEVLNFEDQLALVSHGDTFTVGEGEDLIVIEDSVEVLDPDCIDWPVAGEPDIELRRPRVALLPESGENSRDPVIGDLALHTVHLFVCDCFRVHFYDTIRQSPRNLGQHLR